MLETITAGLLLAAVSGISYLAYKHPPVYRKVVWPLGALIILIQLMIMMWSFGVQFTHLKLMPLIESSKWNQAKEAVNSILPRWWLVALACVGASTYLILLYWLPQLLDQEKEESPDEPSTEKKDENV